MASAAIRAMAIALTAIGERERERERELTSALVAVQTTGIALITLRAVATPKCVVCTKFA